MGTTTLINQLTVQEFVRLMQILITEEELIQKKLAAQIHSNNSNLCALGLFLQKHERALTTGILGQEPFKQEQELITTVVNDLRDASCTLYPKIIDHLGLVKYLYGYASELNEKDGYKVFVDFPKQEIIFPKVLEVGVFKLCTEILKLFSMVDPKTVLIKLQLEDGEWYFSFHSSCELDTKNSEIKLRLNVIRARMLYLQAKVSNDTNWENYFKFGFTFDSN